ncbi:MAG: hypothetical protein PUE32_00635 [Clostridia bacterium]|nr:hypothetical protein [Clostridia bacterium]
MNNSKKKWPVVAGVIAAVLVLALIIFFAVPYVKDLSDPNKKAVTAMKNAGADYTSDFSKRLNEMADAASSGRVINSEGYVTFDKLNINSQDYLSYLNVNTVKFSYDSDFSNGVISGTLELSKDNGDTAATVRFYSDDKTFYFKVPELTSYNFKMNYTDAGNNSKVKGMTGSYSEEIKALADLFRNIDSEDMKSYTKAVESLMTDILTGYNMAVDEFTYSAGDKTTYTSGEYSEDVRQYTVTITKQALLNGANAAVDAVFDDESISGYRTLITSYYKNSREKLKAAVEEKLAGFKDFSIVIYVNKDEKIVAWDCQNSEYSAVIENLLNGKFNRFAWNVESNGVKLSAESISDNGDNAKVSIGISGRGIESSYRGEAKQSYKDGAQVKASEFSSAINVAELTNSQAQSVIIDVFSHADLFSKLLAPSLLQQLE